MAAERILRVVRSAAPPLRNQVDGMSSFFLFLNWLLPRPIRDAILLHHMDIKV
jgi:hypothetical protein